MALNVDWYDIKKYYLKWFRVLDCLKGLGFKSYICHLRVI